MTRPILPDMTTIDRRFLLRGAAAGSLLASISGVAYAKESGIALPSVAQPVPMEDVRLLPSPLVASRP